MISLGKERASQVKSALMRARTIIAKRERWVKHTERAMRHGGDEHGYGYCSIGAIKQATNVWGNDELIASDSRLAQDAINFLGVTIGRSVANWNDSQYTDHDTVVAGFDQAIAAAERQARS